MAKVSGIPVFERFFRAAAGLDVDKDDLKRYTDFVNQKVYDLLLEAHANAEANGRDIVQPRDLPVTKGLQESMHRFRRLAGEVGDDLEPLLEQLVTWRPQDVELDGETSERLPEFAGGLSVALAETFTIVDANVRNPQTPQWERTFRIFDLLL